MMETIHSLTTTDILTGLVFLATVLTVVFPKRMR